jgi:hypothetical protein
MPIHYDIETDSLYLKGIEKGISITATKMDYLFVSNLLKGTDFSNDKIAYFVDVPLSFVIKIKHDLTNKKNKA